MCCESYRLYFTRCYNYIYTQCLYNTVIFILLSKPYITNSMCVCVLFLLHVESSACLGAGVLVWTIIGAPAIFFLSSLITLMLGGRLRSTSFKDARKISV
jgi:hypothetical protein